MSSRPAAHPHAPRRRRHAAEEVVKPLPLLLVAVAMRAAASGQTEALGPEHGVPPPRAARGDGKRLDQVADAGVQGNQSPGETRLRLWFHPIAAGGNQRGPMILSDWCM